jgi:hypothetical protein
MGFYKVKENRTVKVGQSFYEAGDLVELTLAQLNYHAANVELAESPFDASTPQLNLETSRGNDLSRTIGIGIKTIEISEFIGVNPLEIKTEINHGLASGDRVFVYAFQNSSLSRIVVISGEYFVTRLSGDRFSILVDGTAIPLPEVGYVDFMENISQSVFQGKIYEPKKLTQQILTEAKASTVSGSRFVQLKGVREPAKGLKPGHRLTVNAATSGALIQSISLENNDNEAVVLLESPASATISNAFWFAEFETYDPTQKGLFVKDISVVKNTDRSEITISVPTDPAMELDNYLYSITENKNGIASLILRGNIIYG